MTQNMPMKVRALSPERVERIGREVKAAYPRFESDAFARATLDGFAPLELKGRIRHTAEMLRAFLPGEPADALGILLRSLPATPEAAGSDSDFGLYIYAPHSEFVKRFCRTPELLAPALDALAQFSPYFSAEDACRFFINDFPDETLRAVRGWSEASDYRVRRLASEAMRPRLPWSTNINLPIDAGLPVLERLYADEHRFVTQSVANHLKDIAEQRAGLVLATLGRWKSATPGAKDLAFICREALLTRLKSGDRAAYAFLGYQTDVPVTSQLYLNSTLLREGDELAFDVELTAAADAKLRVNYAIAAPGANGTDRLKTWVMKASLAAAAGSTVHLSKRHALRSTATWPLRHGPHAIEIHVNGRMLARAGFEVTPLAAARERRPGRIETRAAGGGS
jgi:3-methyladenine DNA glycosylase AlkC